MRYTLLRRALAALMAAVAVFHMAEGALVLVLAGVCSPPADDGATAFDGLRKHLSGFGTVSALVEGVMSRGCGR